MLKPTAEAIKAVKDSLPRGFNNEDIRRIIQMYNEIEFSESIKKVLLESNWGNTLEELKDIVRMLVRHVIIVDELQRTLGFNTIGKMHSIAINQQAQELMEMTLR